MSKARIKNLIFIFLLLNFFGEILVARTFTSADGRKFTGELISVSIDEVEIFRNSDQKVFKCSKKLFSNEDNEYFKSWHKDTAIWSFGRSVDAIDLFVDTKSFKTKKIKEPTGNYKISGNATLSEFSYPVGNYYNHQWFNANINLDLKLEKEYNDIRLRSTKLEIDLTSVGGPVLTRLYTIFLVKNANDKFIAELDINDLVVRLVNDPIYVESKYLPNYYGYGVVAFNLATGKLIGLSANTYETEKFILNLINDI